MRAETQKLGDSVMFVSDDAVAAIEIALALIDYSGAVVNLAARAVGVARSSSLLVDSETVSALDGNARFTCTPAGSYELKGFGEGTTLTFVQRRD